MPFDTLRVATRCRVVLDNDWSGDPDGLVALAHHLLSPGNRVDAVTSSFLDPAFGSPVARAADGAALAGELVRLIGRGQPPVFSGTDEPFRPGHDSAAARAIVAAARRDDALPLVVVCGGPLTNVAAALDLAPDVASRLTLAWVGGSRTGAAEYNRDTDPAAAEWVFAHAGLDVRQFPLETYRQVAYSVAELASDLGDGGPLGRWLWSRFVELPLPEWLEVDAVWPLGDSAPLIGTALSDASSTFETVPGTARRVCTALDTRLIIGDMLARFRLHDRGAE